MKLALEFVQPMPLMIWAAILSKFRSVRAQLTGRRGRRLVLIVLQLLNVLVGFIEELRPVIPLRSERSLKPEAIVKRENKIYTINATLLVQEM